jgi:signal transduction histidine kinase/DNA-binding NarL/FixJ family response regulator
MDFFGTDATIAALDARLKTGGDGLARHMAELAWYLRERDPVRAEALLQQARNALGGDSTALGAGSVQARLLLVQAHLQAQANVPVEGMRLTEEAAAMFGAEEDFCGAGDARLTAAAMADMQGRFAQRDAFIDAARDHYRMGRDPLREQIASLVRARDAALRDADAALELLALSSAPADASHPAIHLLLQTVHALVAAMRGKSAVAAEHFRRAHHHAVACGAMVSAATCACNVAACCINLNDFVMAAEWSSLALDVARPRRFNRAMASALYYGAESLRHIGRMDEARSMAREARTRLGAPATRLSRNHAVACGVDGMISLSLGDLPHALESFTEGAAIARELGLQDVLAYSLVHEAQALHRLGRSEAAWARLDDALTRADPHFRADALHIQAEIARDRGMPVPAGSSAPTAAMHYLQQAIATAAGIPGHQQSPEWLAELAREHERCGDLAAALDLERQAASGRETLHSRRADDMAATLQVRYETERMTAEAALLKALAAEQAERAKAETRRAEAERRRADAEVHANRLKSNFLANMSHELRSPLNAMLGFTRIMLRDPALAHRHEELRIVMGSGEHLYDLINQVMELAKIEAGRAALVESEFDLAALLEDLRGVYGAQAVAKGLMFSIGIDEEAPRWIRADAVKLRQVLASLVGNAVKFTGEGFVRVKVMTAPSGSLLDFVIEDSGPGMHSADVGHLGQAFMQAIGPSQGVVGPGLGLAVSRSFVKLMGGELQIHSEPGCGTRVSFTVPVLPLPLEPGLPPAGQRRVKALLPGRSTPRVLIVDDRAEARLLLARTLEPIGFEVREAADGRQAVTVWREWSPQLVLMDMRMPVMDGREATQRIKSMAGGADTVIIAVTASTFDEQREQILRLGCDDFIRKPFSEDALLHTIARHLGLAYAYEQAVTVAAQPPDNALLASLPPELKARLSDALERLDVRAVEEAIDAVRAVDPAAADGLLPLARQFDYARIKALLT